MHSPTHQPFYFIFFLYNPIYIMLCRNIYKLLPFPSSCAFCKNEHFFPYTLQKQQFLAGFHFSAYLGNNPSFSFNIIFNSLLCKCLSFQRHFIFHLDVHSFCLNYCYSYYVQLFKSFSFILNRSSSIMCF